MGIMSPDEKLKKAISLDNAEELDIEIWSGDGNVEQAVNELYLDLNTLPNFDGNALKRKSHIRAVCINLFHQFMLDPDSFTSYNRNNNFYSLLKPRYNPNGISKLLAAIVDAMEAKGYIENYPGYFDRVKGKSRLSRMRATDKLISLMKKHGIRDGYIEKSPKTECLILRASKAEADKDELEYPDTPARVEMRKSLCAYNNLIRRTFIDIPDYAVKEYENGLIPEQKVKINLNEKFVKRIFSNGSWKDGGRFYGGWWQRLRKELREKIRINHEPVIEVDYSGLHIILLYALEGTDYWKVVGKDPYELPGYPVSDRLRKLLKFILLIIINAKTKEKALKASRQKINFNKDFYPWVYDEGIDLEQIVIDFTENHKLINKYFFSGYGIKLQRLDSVIAEHVINEFTKEEIPVLCIHDSFIVQSAHEMKLKKRMLDAFTREINRIGLGGKGLVPKTTQRGIHKEAYENYWSVLWEEPLPEKFRVFCSPDSEKKDEMKGYLARLEAHKNRAWEKEYYCC